MTVLFSRDVIAGNLNIFMTKQRQKLHLLQVKDLLVYLLKFKLFVNLMLYSLQ